MLSFELRYFKKHIIILFFTLSFFFSHLDFLEIQFRFVFLILFALILFDQNLKKMITSKLIIFSFVITIFIFLHHIIMFDLTVENKAMFNETNNNYLKTLFQSIVIFLSIIILYKFKKIILENFNKILFIYLIIFFLLITINQIKNFDILEYLYTCNTGFFSNKKFIYEEDSHFHIVAAPLIIYCFYNYNYLIKKYLFTFLFILFSVITFGLFSLTLYLSISIGVAFVFLACRNLGKIRIFLFLFLLIINNSFFFYGKNSDIIVNNKIPNIDHILLQDSQNACKTIKADNHDGSITNPKQKFVDLKYIKDFDQNDNPMNLSLKIYLTSLKFAKDIFIEYPFGLGINNYSYKFTKVNNAKNSNLVDKDGKTRRLYIYNTSDGSNNLSKLIVEFGIFGIITLFILAYFSFTKFLEEPIKAFFYTSLLIQIFIRGSGFFFNGFFLILIILILSVFEKQKNE